MRYFEIQTLEVEIGDAGAPPRLPTASALGVLSGGGMRYFEIQTLEVEIGDAGAPPRLPTASALGRRVEEEGSLRPEIDLKARGRGSGRHRSPRRSPT